MRKNLNVMITLNTVNMLLRYNFIIEICALTWEDKLIVRGKDGLLYEASFYEASFNNGELIFNKYNDSDNLFSNQ